jgi:hypothetical protein
MRRLADYVCQEQAGFLAGHRPPACWPDLRGGAPWVVPCPCCKKSLLCPAPRRLRPSTGQPSPPPGGGGALLTTTKTQETKPHFFPPPAPSSSSVTVKEAHRARVQTQTRVRFQRRGPSSPIDFGPRSPSPRESPIGFGPRSPSPRASPIGCGLRSPSPRTSPIGFGPRSPSPRASPIGFGPRSPSPRKGLIWQAIYLD